LADNPQQTIRELRDLVVEYTKQETVEPIKGLGRYIGYGLGAALLLGFGFMFLSIGILRLIQEETFPHLTGNWSWVPYLITVVIMAIGVAIAVWFMRRAQRKVKASLGGDLEQA
jgi:hypothetical protein